MRNRERWKTQKDNGTDEQVNEKERCKIGIGKGIEANEWNR